MAKDKAFEDVPIRRIESKTDTSVQTFRFEMTKLNHTVDNVDFVVEPHRHDYYHMMYITNGVGEHSIDFKTFEIKPNAIFFVSPGQVHALRVSPDVEGYVISFNKDFFHLNNTQTRLDFPFFHSISNAPVVYLSSDKEPKISQTWDDLYEEYQLSHSSTVKMLKALFEVLLIRISRVYTQQPIHQETTVYLTTQLRTLESLIDTHFKTQKLLSDYANLMHVTPKHLNSICKKGLNKTVTNLIHERLLIEAKRLLLFTTNSITDITFELGFTDKSYFMRFFKKHTGVTADTFRQQQG